MPRGKDCLETRTRADGIVRRRYRLPDGSTETTYEISDELFRKLTGRPERIAPQPSANINDLFKLWTPTTIKAEATPPSFRDSAI